MKENYNQATMIDVRTQEEYADEHIPNAINIPLDQVSQRINEFKAMQKPLVLYCRSGNRSGIAISILQQYGINDAINAGGIDDVKQNNK